MDGWDEWMGVFFFRWYWESEKKKKYSIPPPTDVL